MVSKEAMAKILPLLQEKANFTLAEVMDEVYLDDEISYTKSVGIERKGDDALTKKWLAYYSGERKTKPTAISDQKTVNDAADGTEGRKMLNHPQIKADFPEHLVKGGHFRNLPEIIIRK